MTEKECPLCSSDNLELSKRVKIESKQTCRDCDGEGPWTIVEIQEYIRPLVWSSERPTVAGHYFVRHPLFEIPPKVWEIKEAEIGFDLWASGTEFAGPVPIPQEPNA